MRHSVLEMKRWVRRRLRRVVHRSRDADYVRRCAGMLTLFETGNNVSETARRCHARRATVRQWRQLYETEGEAGLMPRSRGREDYRATDIILAQLNELVRRDPTDLGYLRSRWSSELLALELSRQGWAEVHATTVRRWLARLCIVWRRARPTLHIADPRKARRMRAIRRALRRASVTDEVFYVDEADIDLNPRLGPAWTPRGVQAAIPTPGRNRKRYVAGALNARTGRVIWVEHSAKNSELFLRLMDALSSAYRRARRLYVILDNYRIHDSRVVQGWLARHPRVKRLFQPSYHPWVNRIELLWKQLHDTVTRNHHCKNLDTLMNAVRRFMQVCQPFPGNQPALASAA